jgi:hypothetical protein
VPFFGTFTVFKNNKTNNERENTGIGILFIKNKQTIQRSMREGKGRKEDKGEAELNNFQAQQQENKKLTNGLVKRN